jgi:hypothetical protein
MSSYADSKAGPDKPIAYAPGDSDREAPAC